MIVAIIQARSGSTRLPGKVLKTLGSTSVIHGMFDRVRQCDRLDRVVIAMPEGAEDDALADHVAGFCPDISRGSEADVLDRYFRAAESFGADTVVRITSDCPFFDPDILGLMIDAFLNQKPDYMSNVLDPYLPRGLDAEVFTMDALRKAHRDGTAPHEREHVTPHLYQNPDRFRLAPFRHDPDNNWSDLRWTLDTPQDWDLIDRMHALLPVDYQAARLHDFLALYDTHPELRTINAEIRQKTLDE